MCEKSRWVQGDGEGLRPKQKKRADAVTVPDQNAQITRRSLSLERGCGWLTKVRSRSTRGCLRQEKGHVTVTDATCVGETYPWPIFN